MKKLPIGIKGKKCDKIKTSGGIDNNKLPSFHSLVSSLGFKFCKKIPGIIIFRGSENDVLGRISKLIERYKIVTHVECFGDSPLLDPKIIDQYIEKFKKNNFDCITNTLKNTDNSCSVSSF